MGSTEKGRIEIGPALKALAAASAPSEPDLAGALAESRRRKEAARSRLRVAGLAAAAALAVGLPLGFLGSRAAFRAEPGLASGLESDLAQSALWPGGEPSGRLEAELDSYIVALWDSSY